MKNINNGIESLEVDLMKLKEWSDNNHLVFNENKAKTMLFSMRELDLQDKNAYTIKLNFKDIKRGSSMKILGMILNEYLIWDEHIQKK